MCKDERVSLGLRYCVPTDSEMMGASAERQAKPEAKLAIYFAPAALGLPSGHRATWNLLDWPTLGTGHGAHKRATVYGLANVGHGPPRWSVWHYPSP